MKKKIILASNNAGKIKEYQNAFKTLNVEILSLKDIGLNIDVEETAIDFKGNALLKAKTIYNKVKIPVLADDSGIVVKALPNYLGVKSKRFSTSGKDLDNNYLLLEMLKDKSDRSAQFVCVICLYMSDDDIRFFEGITTGKILEEFKGDAGFGYDPLFLVDGSNKTYGEMTLDEKQIFSHRGKAIEKMVKYGRFD
ncbi:MAG: non-canonical purine NTP pyrophosphatase, RdgB/HAM1 family [Tenericutes bacterium HGW-Tenericutes-5]|nr:MAG: non-canonical purine NTP pyrophosphatase, RdgB/HAM1 family [Tenericutes bacterium HGW-Tenericutes-5]